MVGCVVQPEICIAFFPLVVIIVLMLLMAVVVIGGDEGSGGVVMVVSKGCACHGMVGNC